LSGFGEIEAEDPVDLAGPLADGVCGQSFAGFETDAIVVDAEAMKLPFKVSTTTSDFMIGVTAAASTGIYLSRGYIDPTIAMPVMLGVLAGSLFGIHILVKTGVKTLKNVFVCVIIALGVEMIYSGIAGKI
jgi:hypothetical protein